MNAQKFLFPELEEAIRQESIEKSYRAIFAQMHEINRKILVLEELLHDQTDRLREIEKVLNIENINQL